MKSLNKIIVIISIILPNIFAVGCDSRDNQSKENNSGCNDKIVFRLATNLSKSDIGWETARMIVDELNNQSGGKIHAKLFDSGSLGAERQLLETCYVGVIEMVLCTSSVVSTIDKVFGLLDMPYLFMDKEHQHNVLNGVIGDEILDGLRDYNFQGLAFYSIGFRNVFNTRDREINSPEDMNGLKIRVMESPVMIQSINAMGASATPLSASELFHSLKTGVVDGAENNVNMFTSSKIFEAGCKNYSMTKHFSNQLVLVANREWFDKINHDNPDVAAFIRKVSNQIIKDHDIIWDREEFESIEKMKSNDVIINYIDDLSIFRDRVQSVYDNYFKKNPDISADIINRIREMDK